MDTTNGKLPINLLKKKKRQKQKLMIIWIVNIAGWLEKYNMHHKYYGYLYDFPSYCSLRNHRSINCRE